MTQEEKLEIVYKKIFNRKAFTKNGTAFFEEPIKTSSQIPLSYIYVNSNQIPETAPMTTITFAGVETLRYIEKEPSIAIDSGGKRFKARNGKIIPRSYGFGYGIEARTQTGSIIDQDEFPFIVDWESGEVIFDTVPLGVGFHEPPLFTYHFYSGSSLQDVKTFTQQGQRGKFGDQGETGPIDDSVLVYRGKTSFTMSPPVQYMPNDVVTFLTNGNSYICKVATTSSPIASPSSWENLSPSGSFDEMPENVFYVNHPNAIPISGLRNGSAFYFTSLQDAINNSGDGIPTLIIVNPLNGLYPISQGDIVIENKTINILFKKTTNLFSEEAAVSGFTFVIRDSDVMIQNAQIGGPGVFKKGDGSNSLIIESSSTETRLRLFDCKINTKLISVSRSAQNNCTVIFERCSINPERIITGSDIIIKDSVFSGSITGDYSSDAVQGVKHIFHIINSIGFQRATRGSSRSLQGYDIVLVANRSDLSNFSVKLENSFLPGLGVSIVPSTFLYSTDVFKIDANNSIFYSIGVDSVSSKNGARIDVIGSNINYAVLFDSFTSVFFTKNGFTIDDFYFSIEGPGGQKIPVVTWPSGSTQVFGYDAYKILIQCELEKSMLSL
jgi:hypothetical protein